mmetsp:Transcript_14812/g.37423  ORF Transcript_14812/g.37423 Transcript_14812/m.37423 type:complete len:233 (-) Transcript_14812:96-794(-)
MSVRAAVGSSGGSSVTAGSNAPATWSAPLSAASHAALSRSSDSTSASLFATSPAETTAARYVGGLARTSSRKRETTSPSAAAPSSPRALPAASRSVPRWPAARSAARPSSARASFWDAGVARALGGAATDVLSELGTGACAPVAFAAEAGVDGAASGSSGRSEAAARDLRRDCGGFATDSSILGRCAEGCASLAAREDAGLAFGLALGALACSSPTICRLRAVFLKLKSILS